MKTPVLFLVLIICSLGFGSALNAQANSPKLKDLNGFFPFQVPNTLEEWETRKELLQRRVLVANGLYPMPGKTPLNAVIHGKVERPGFTVEKVYFESLPGLHVTGLLFRPANAKPGQKFPAVLSPHGHGGRLQDFGEAGVKKQIEMGGEKFEDSGRFPKVARCANLARLGCVVLIYDMIGYADNQQLSRSLAHGFRSQRPHFEGKDSWGFFSAQAEMRMQSIFGLQTWNTIRGLDFLESLPDVDPSRLAVTGGSGGGTQTIMICAIDDRPVAAFPNGMVSSSMQGGCPCENASLLRIGTGNVELTALFAPKPQGMTAANDWTKEMLVPGKGFPELKKLYSMYGKPDNVICEDLLRFPHNYNVVTREIMYNWFNKHLQLGLKEPIQETDFKHLTAEEHAVYNDQHPRPEGGDAFERKLTKWLAEDSDQQLAKLCPTEKQKVILHAWQTMIGLDDPVDNSNIPTLKGEQTVLRILNDDESLKETAIVPNPRQVAAYTHGYNHSYFANRVRDLYGIINKSHKEGKKVIIKAEKGKEALALAAAVISPTGSVQEIILEDDSFRFADIQSYRDINFVPGAVKYGDVPGLIETTKSLGIKVSLEKMK
jgi:dienelactone hydrolase